MKIAYRKAQNTAEYAILIALVIGAVIAMQTYIKRGWQGGMKFAVDKLKKDGGTAQYEPYYLETSYEAVEDAYTDTVKTTKGGEVERITGSVASPHKTTRTGYQEIKVAK